MFEVLESEAGEGVQRDVARQKTDLLRRILRGSEWGKLAFARTRISSGMR